MQVEWLSKNYVEIKGENPKEFLCIYRCPDNKLHIISNLADRPEACLGLAAVLYRVLEQCWDLPKEVK